MCGIAGFLTANNAFFEENTIREMLKCLTPRGPDGTSWMAVTQNRKNEWRKLSDPLIHKPLHHAIGCSRLALQDITDAGLQPITNAKKDIWVVLNGEIFNFIELRKELESYGFIFTTNTDTECIVHAYDRWGVDCFSHFNGSFAIGIFDSKKSRFILARDRMGVRPLFFHLKKAQLLFASEIKSLLTVKGISREVNISALNSTISLPYKLHGKLGQTMFKHIEEVKPGERIIFNQELEPFREFYWSMNQNEEEIKMEFDEVVEQLRELFINAVKIRLRSDRRLAFILSGGIDSSSILGIASKVHGVGPECFSLDIPDSRFNENDSIRENISFTDVTSHFIPVTPEAVIQSVESVVDIYDEPTPTANCILHNILAKAIDKEGFKVVLNGVGGDEAFLGYHDHFLYFLKYLEGISAPEFDSEINAWREIQGRPITTFESFSEFLINGTINFNPDFLARSKNTDYSKTLRKEFKSLSFKPIDLFKGDFSPRKKQAIDISRLTLPHALKMEDRFYMAHAVEARHPLLDYRLIEFGLSIPPEFKIKKGISKYVLRESVKGFIPESRRKDPNKIGLNLPIDVWMKGALKKWMFDHIADSQNPVFEYADFEFIQGLLREFLDGEKNHSMKFWDLINLNLWLLKYG